MPVTVNVNKISVSHQGSDGKLMSFPDVCKTPSPAGPVPIPYPNIAMTSDLSEGTTKVKVDGNPVMTKKSKISTSTGDEAGSAQGLLSNKVKGKAQAILYSFDVKFEGQNVVRLTDPALQNMGSANAFGPALLQAPLVVLPEIFEGCAAAIDEQEKQKETHKEEAGKCGAGWNDSGVFLEHQKAFQNVSDILQVVIYIRNGNWYCVNGGKNKWIPDHHQPKPHDIIEANTIKPEPEKGHPIINMVSKWLALYASITPGIPNYPSPEQVEELYGVVCSKVRGQEGKPLHAQRSKYDSNCYTYKNKWITGDYDLQDIMSHAKPDCVRVAGVDFAAIKWLLNKEMGWDGIQHGPQQAWEAVEGVADESQVVHKGETFSMPNMITTYLKKCANEGAKNVKVPEVRITPKGPNQRTLPVIDKKLTIVSPGKSPLVTNSDADAANALICYGCHTLQTEEEKQEEQEKSTMLRERKGFE